MRKIEALCPAKINLTFDIKGRFPDGYHEVETLYQAVSLYDRILFEWLPSQKFGVNIETDDSVPAEFPPGPDNIIYKAANLFRQNLPDAADFALRIAINKIIPIGAGLGGASSNAAATLLALNTFFKKPFSSEQLTAIAAKVGADVAFFIEGGLALGTGRGEKLKSLNALPELWIVLVKPRSISIQTSWAYECFDKYICDVWPLPKPDWRVAVDALQTEKLGNVFEPVIFKHYPQLADLKNAIKAAGANCCSMTGSGSALYGLADSREHAGSIVKQLNHSASDVDIFIAQTIKFGVQLGEMSEAEEEDNQKATQQIV